MIILASRSPRRRELLAQAQIPFRCVDVAIDESHEPPEAPSEYVVRLAERKAQAGRSVDSGLPVLGSDTAVTVDGEILGKPADRNDAVNMLRRLSGREHEVVTAVALTDDTGTKSLLSTSTVRFARLADAWIEHYVESNEPHDKAGSYAIQGAAACMIEHLSGSYSGVMGLPLYETCLLLRRSGLEIV